MLPTIYGIHKGKKQTFLAAYQFTIVAMDPCNSITGRNTAHFQEAIELGEDC